MKSAQEMRQLGQDIGDFIEQKAIENGLGEDEMLTLILSVTYGWAEFSKLVTEQNPRPLFERAAQVWDTIRRTRKIQIVSEVPIEVVEHHPGFQRRHG